MSMANPADKKHVLFVLQQAPLSGVLARAGIDTVLAYAAFEQPISVLFSGAGVLQLAPDATPSRVGRRDLRRIIDSMPLYDIDRLYADRSALAAYGLGAGLPEFIEVIDARGMRTLYDHCDHLISF